MGCGNDVSLLEELCDGVSFDGHNMRNWQKHKSKCQSTACEFWARVHWQLMLYSLFRRLKKFHWSHTVVFNTHTLGNGFTPCQVICCCGDFMVDNTIWKIYFSKLTYTLEVMHSYLRAFMCEHLQITGFQSLVLLADCSCGVWYLTRGTKTF